MIRPAPETYGFSSIHPERGTRPALVVYGKRALEACHGAPTVFFHYHLASLPEAWPSEREAELRQWLQRLAERPVIVWAEDGDDGIARANRHVQCLAAAGASAVALYAPGFQPWALSSMHLDVGGIREELERAWRIGEARALPPQGRVKGHAVPPCAGPIDHADLLAGLRSFIARHLDGDGDLSLVIALWCLHAWRAGEFILSPRLVFQAMDARAEHAAALRLVAWLTPRPLLLSRAFAGQLLQLMEANAPTLLLDDVAGGLLYRRDIRTLLTAGAHADAAFITGTYAAKAVTCFAAAAIATAATVPDDLAARAIVIKVQPPSAGCARPPIAYDKPPAEVISLRAQLQAFALQQAPLPDGGTPHATWAPLLGIAHLVGATVADDATRALQRLTDIAPRPASNLALLADIAALFAVGENLRIPTAQMIERLVSDPELPWAGLKRGAKLGARDLAERLGQFGVRPTTFRMPDGAIVRGYRGADLKDAVGRYLPYHRAAE